MGSDSRQHQNGNNERWRPLLWLIPIGLIGNLLYALSASDRETLRTSLNVDVRWLLLAFLLAVMPLVFNTCRVWRWGRLLMPGFRRQTALRTVLCAELGAAMTPTAIGGAPLKVAVLARSGLGTSGGVALATLGGLEDACFIIPAIILTAWRTGLLPRFMADLNETIAAIPSGANVPSALIIAFFALAAPVLLLRHQRAAGLRHRIVRWFDDVRCSLRIARNHGRGVFAGNVALAGFQWSARLSIFAALAVGLGTPLEPLRAAVLQWLCFTCMALVPTPGAIGGAEASFVLVLGQELPAPILPLAMAAWRLITFYGLNLASIGALILMQRRSPLTSSGANQASESHDTRCRQAGILPKRLTSAVFRE